jgi:hypothetical protein
VPSHQREGNASLEWESADVLFPSLLMSKASNVSSEQYRTALDMDPNLSFAPPLLAQLYEQRGLFEQAVSES